MQTNALARSAGEALPRLLAWADRRLQEPSTIIGIATVLGAAGYSTLGAGLTSHADLITMAAGILGSGLVAATTSQHPPAPPAPADPAKASPVISMENTDMSVSTILVAIENDALDVLKAAGKAFETFIITEGQKLVAEVKQTYVGTVALNIVQALESQTMSGEQKLETVVSAVVPLITKLVASGGVSGAIASVESFALEFAQSVYNDFKADVAKLTGGTAAQAQIAA